MLKKEFDYKNVVRKNADELSEFFIQLQSNLIQNGHYRLAETAIEVDTFLLNLFSNNEKSAKLVWDFKKFQMLAVTPNIEKVFGIALEDMQNFNNSMTFLYPEHLMFVAKCLEWMNQIFEDDELSKNYSYKLVICGLNFINKKEEVSRVLIRASTYTFDEKGYVETLVVSIEKIGFMMKSDIAWARLAYGENEHKIAYIATNDLEGKKSDIISDREKEILTCLLKGMDTQEIAKTLFISANTIIKHRKNMLARTGLCDTTALIQICQSCGILA